MNAAVEPRANLPALTGIRGLAAWFVVLYHIRAGATSQLPPEVIAFFAKGYLAVDLFFMLSGFVLWLNYTDRLRGARLGAVAHFMWGRIARIWPLHVAMLACAAVFAIVIATFGTPADDQFPWAELPLHILMIQNWGLTSTLTWNVPAWSISCEFAAYLLFPLLVAAVDWRRLPSAALVALVGGLALLLHLIMSVAGAATLGDQIPRLGLVRVFCEFGMGTIICVLWARWREAPTRPAVASLILAVTFLALWGAGALPETLGIPLFLAALLVFLSLTASSAANPLGSRAVHYLGEISYSTYLVHYLLFMAFKFAFVEDAGQIPLWQLGLFLALTLAASVALFHGVERPAQRALNRRFARSRRPIPEAVPERV